MNKSNIIKIIIFLKIKINKKITKRKCLSKHKLNLIKQKIHFNIYHVYHDTFVRLYK